jgi:DNA polymerase III subunit alpha
MDSLGPRESMLASVDDAINAIQRAMRAKESGQHGLFFGGGSNEPKVHFELRDAAPWTEEERLASEYSMLGFYVSGHPLEKHASRLKGLGAISLDEVEGQRNGKEIAVAGLIVGTRPMRSKKGQRWAIFTLQDMTGVQELLAFPESFGRLESILQPGQPLLLKVRVQVEEAGTRLSLQEARRLEAVAETNGGPSEFRLQLDLQRLNDHALAQLEELFSKAAGPSTVVFEVKATDGTTAVVQSQRKIRVTPDFIAALDRICGDEGIQRIS